MKQLVWHECGVFSWGGQEGWDVYGAHGSNLQGEETNAAETGGRVSLRWYVERTAHEDFLYDV